MLSILDGGEYLCGLVVIAPARRAGDPGSIPGPGENFSLKLLTFYYVGKRNGILHKNRGEGFKKILRTLTWGQGGGQKLPKSSLRN